VLPAAELDRRVPAESAIHAFVSASREVLSALLPPRSVRERLRSHAEPVDQLDGEACVVPRDELNVTVAVCGDSASVTWSFPCALVERFAAVTAPDTSALVDRISAAALELANVLTGRSIKALDDLGLATSLSTPTLASHSQGGIVSEIASPLGTIAITFHGAWTK
jgi:CheY-specific phosphatase CheX